MRQVFRWFYCLPIAVAVLIFVLATRIFLVLREKYRDMQYRKTLALMLLIFWVAVILFGTLGQRTEGGNLSAPVLVPFASYHAAFNGNRELFRANIMNILLFYPAGLLGGEILPESWNRVWKVASVTLFLALGSISIEYIQYRFGMGLAETDDVIHNTLGAISGAIACGASIKWKRRLHCCGRH